MKFTGLLVTESNMIAPPTLQRLGIPFRLVQAYSSPIIEWSARPDLRVASHALDLARAATAVRPGEWVLATAILADERALLHPPPSSDDEMRRLLITLSGRTCSLITGIALFNPLTRCNAMYFVNGRITLRTLTVADIERFLTGLTRTTGSDLRGRLLNSSLVIRLEGCCDVPICAIARLLQEWGLSIPPAQSCAYGHLVSSSHGASPSLCSSDCALPDVYPPHALLSGQILYNTIYFNKPNHFSVL